MSRSRQTPDQARAEALAHEAVAAKRATTRAKAEVAQCPAPKAKAVSPQPAPKPKHTAPTRPRLDESHVAALTELRGEIDRSDERHRDLRLEFFFIDERWPGSEDQHRAIMEGFADNRISEEDDDDRWRLSPDAKLWSRFYGDVGAVEEFERLARSFGLVLQSARIIDGKNVEMPMGLILYLAVCRPTPLLEAEIGFCYAGPSQTSPPVQHVGLKHPAFASLRATIDFMLSPSEVVLLPATEAISPSALPNSDGMSRIVATVEGRPAPPSMLVVGDHYIAYRKRRCNFEPGKPFELISELSNAPGKHFSYEELWRAKWPVISDVNDITLQQHMSLLRKILKAAGMEGITIKGSKGHYQLVLT
jgi:hypothetical protein